MRLETKRIYVIVAKKLKTKPPMKVEPGYAISQAHHATVMATKRFDLSPWWIVITLQVADTRELKKLASSLHNEKIPFVIYPDMVSRRNDQECVTAIVTTGVVGKPKCLKRKRLWK